MVWRSNWGRAWGSAPRTGIEHRALAWSDPRNYLVDGPSGVAQAPEAFDCKGEQRRACSNSHAAVEASEIVRSAQTARVCTQAGSGRPVPWGTWCRSAPFEHADGGILLGRDISITERQPGPESRAPRDAAGEVATGSTPTTAARRILRDDLPAPWQGRSQAKLPHRARVSASSGMWARSAITGRTPRRRRRSR